MNFEIPENFPLSDFISQDVTQICIGIGEVSIHFYTPSATVGQWEPGACITIESGFELSQNGLPICVSGNKSIGLAAGGLTTLLGKTVVSVKRLPNNEISLSFSNNLTLRLISNQKGYESYHLSVSGEEIDV